MKFLMKLSFFSPKKQTRKTPLVKNQESKKASWLPSLAILVTLSSALLYTTGWSFAYRFFDAFRLGLIGLEIPREYFFLYGFWIIQDNWGWVLLLFLLTGDGLVRSFRIAGVRSVLMTLQKVDDEQAKDFMIRFYDTWLKEKSHPAVALRKTQLYYINHPNESLRNPDVWSPYVLVE